MPTAHDFAAACLALETSLAEYAAAVTACFGGIVIRPSTAYVSGLPGMGGPGQGMVAEVPAPLRQRLDLAAKQVNADRQRVRRLIEALPADAASTGQFVAIAAKRGGL